MVDCRKERKNNDFSLHAVYKYKMYEYSSTVVTHMKMVLLVPVVLLVDYRSTSTSSNIGYDKITTALTVTASDSKKTCISNNNSNNDEEMAYNFVNKLVIINPQRLR
jgi:hypothetical protein